MTVHVNWREAGSGSRLKYVFARAFATADGHRVADGHARGRAALRERDEPRIQCARTHWNRGLMAFQLTRRGRTGSGRIAGPWPILADHPNVS